MELSRTQHLAIIRALAEEAGGRFRYLNNQHPAYRGEASGWHKIDKRPDAFAVENELGILIHTLPQIADANGAVAKVKDARWLYQIMRSLVEDDTLDSPEHYLEAFKSRLKNEKGIVRGPNVKEAVRSAFFDHVSINDRIAALELKGVHVMKREHHARPDVNMFSPEQLVDSSASVPLLNDAGKQGLLTGLQDIAKLHAMRPEALLMDVHNLFYRASLAVSSHAMEGNTDPAHFPDHIAHQLEGARQVYVEKGGIGVFSTWLSGLTVSVVPVGVNLHREAPAQNLSSLKAMLYSSREGDSPVSATSSPKNPSIQRKVALVKALRLKDQLTDWQSILPLMYQGDKLEIAEKQLAILQDQALPFTHKEAEKNLSTLCKKADMLFSDHWAHCLSSLQRKQAERVATYLQGKIDIAPTIAALHKGAPEPKREPGAALNYFAKMDAFFSESRLKAWVERVDKRKELTIPAEKISAKLTR